MYPLRAVTTSSEQPIVTMLEKRYCAPPLIPEYVHPSPEGWDVCQMYDFCVQYDLQRQGAYLRENWYRKGRWEL